VSRKARLKIHTRIQGMNAMHASAALSVGFTLSSPMQWLGRRSHPGQSVQ
jgi:hypothetical protein